MRFAYADPPYPGKADYYPERQEVDHQALIERLGREFPDGWALSTSAAALQQVLALCPPGVRVCSWQRAVRPTKSKRPISAWEPLIASGGRELAIDGPQVVRDALAYGGRYRRFPGALIGMKPPQFAAWLFAQLGARPGDQLEDLFPGSGAIGEAWRRYTSQPLSERDDRHVSGALPSGDVLGFYAGRAGMWLGAGASADPDSGFRREACAASCATRRSTTGRPRCSPCPARGWARSHIHARNRPPGYCWSRGHRT